jgi:hypothetical protein
MSSSPSSSSSYKNANSSSSAPIQTYNLMGGGLGGFAIPVGLLQMGKPSQLVGGGDFSKMNIPDVTNVDAISHDLYAKLLQLSQFESKKKSRKLKLQVGSRKSKKIR